MVNKWEPAATFRIDYFKIYFMLVETFHERLLREKEEKDNEFWINNHLRKK